MLKGKFYNYTLLENTDGKILSTISFNAEHDIFSGHFPDFPIVPGVCQVQLVKEIINENVASPLVLASAKDIKFINSIDPNNVGELNLEIKYTLQADKSYKCISHISDQEKTYFKSRMNFCEQE